MSSNPNAWRGADIVWDNLPDDDDEVLELEPIDPKTDQARNQMRELRQQTSLEILPDEPERGFQPQTFQFSLSRLLIGTTLVGVVFGVTQWVSPNAIAGTLGIAVFVGIILSAVLMIDEPKIKVAWWGLVAAYVIATVAAVLSR